MKFDSRAPRWVGTLERSRSVLIIWFPPLAVIGLSIPAFIHNGQPLVPSLVLTFFLTAPLLLRRRYPVAVFAIVLAVSLAQWLAGWRLEGDVALLVALYTVASLRPARTAVVVAAALEVGLAIAVMRFSPLRGWLLAFVLLSGLTTAAGVLGVYTRTRVAFLAELSERADRIERERDQQIELAGATERARIARELHDVVAHHLTVMIALADGATAVASTAPARAIDVMTTVASTGRKALADTRRLLGVLRADSADSQRQPQPDISNLEALLEQVRAAGLPATITISGQHRELSPALQLTIYRLVQESLTNTLKHAGPGAHVTVRLRYLDDAVQLDVRDDGLGAAALPGDRSEAGGHGLTGMRERVAAWDGELRAGPAAPRGWVVSATLRPDPAAAEAAVKPVATIR
jgi:signal transduction histidine kinase